MYDHVKTKIVADSYNPNTDSRLTTFEITVPRYIWAEIMTHRMFSRNAQSSRAIPTSKRLDKVRTNPVTPLFWGKNQAGMQSQETEVDFPSVCEKKWLEAADSAACAAESLWSMGLHKQWTNRLLEPFETITGVISSTDYENFFHLRCARDSQPEIHRVAWDMAHLYYNNEPIVVEDVDSFIHLPYINSSREKLIKDYCQEHNKTYREIACASSVACCARVSYLNHDGSAVDIEKDYKLYNMLMESGHWSPFEHIAYPSLQKSFSGNFQGWVQLRKTFQGENKKFNYKEAKCQERKEWY